MFLSLHLGGFFLATVFRISKCEKIGINIATLCFFLEA